MTAAERFDIVVVGAGMAGASLAAELAPHARIALIEAEERPGYHATGRSAAFWMESYGGPDVAPLTAASHAALAKAGVLRPRGCLHLAAAGDERYLSTLSAAMAKLDTRLEPLGRESLVGLIPGLRLGYAAALSEPSCADIDVAALHARYLSRAGQAGAVLFCRAPLDGCRRAGGAWRVDAGEQRIEAPVIVNAAGAWADAVAAKAGARPLGITPYRRTMVQLRVAPAPAADLPLVLDAAGRFYFKPEAGGRLWLTPHDETATIAGDVAPEEADVALAVARLEAVVDWQVEAVERRWAGLRSFAPDRLPVYGFDVRLPGFFWCAGQGGFGIQTAPAAARLAAALLLDEPPHASLRDVDPARYAPDRFG